jgi:DNA-binding NtrC family response regulator
MHNELTNNSALPKILCVDDDPNLLQSIARNLRKEFHVETANSAQEAIQKLGELGNFAVILCDMNMPRVDGITLLKCVKKDFPTVVRIMLTGIEDRDVALRAVKESSIFRFIYKPAIGPEIKQAVKEAFSEHQKLTGQNTIQDNSQIPKTGPNLAQVEVREIKIKNLNESVRGRTIAKDLYSTEGHLLVSSGMILDDALIDKIRNFSLFVGIESPIALFFEHNEVYGKDSSSS